MLFISYLKEINDLIFLNKNNLTNDIRKVKLEKYKNWLDKCDIVSTFHINTFPNCTSKYNPIISIVAYKNNSYSV